MMQLNRHAEAYPLFVDLLDEQPTGPYTKQALFRAAETAVTSGKNAEAEIRLSQFQAQYAGDKLNANILLFRGELALHIGDPAASARWYNASLEKFPDAPIADECRLRLAHVLELQKHSDAAEEQIRTVAEHDHTPWSEMALLQLAARQLAANHPQAALEQYEAIEKRFPNSSQLPQTHLGCGRALYQLGHYAEAVNVLTPLSTNPELASDAKHWIAQAQSAEKRAKAAEKPHSSIETAPPKPPAPTTTSSRRDPKTAVAQQPMESQPADQPSAPAEIAADDDAITPKSITVKHGVEQPSSIAKTAPEKTAVEPTPPAVASTSRAAAAPVNDELSPQRAEQDRRRSAVIRYQAADGMIRSNTAQPVGARCKWEKIPATIRAGFANRYLLAIAFQGVQPER